jgi:hypothetical protein
LVLDTGLYGSFTQKNFTAFLTIDPAGAVVHVRTEPELPASAEAIFARDIRRSLFLPAVENGELQTKVVAIPISL